MVANLIQAPRFPGLFPYDNPASNRRFLMKISANSIRPGMVLDHEGKQWMVLKNQVVQPGKGGAFMQVEMRDIKYGNKSQGRWRTADTVERLDVRELDCQYLFKE